LEDITSGKAEEDGAVLSRFLLISFADLKKWSFRYWFAFPALVLDPPATILNLQPASKILTVEEVSIIRLLFPFLFIFRSIPFWLVSEENLV